MKTQIKNKNTKIDWQAKCIEAERRSSELEEKWKMALADYLNLEKRVEEQKQVMAMMAMIGMAARVIAALDDLYLANDHLKDDGLKMAIGKFMDSMKTEGLEEIKVQPEDKYDAQKMECLSTESGETDKVIRVVKRGYMLNGQVIRPAGVIVGTSKIITN